MVPCHSNPINMGKDPLSPTFMFIIQRYPWLDAPVQLHCIPLLRMAHNLDREWKYPKAHHVGVYPITSGRFLHAPHSLRGASPSRRLVQFVSLFFHPFPFFYFHFHYYFIIYVVISPLVCISYHFSFFSSIFFFVVSTHDILMLFHENVHIIGFSWSNTYNLTSWSSFSLKYMMTFHEGSKIFQKMI